MAGNSLNLVELTKEYLTSDFTSKLSALLGESRDTTQLGINMAIPGLLSELDSAASSPDGARRLASAVDSTDDGMLTSIAAAFGRGSLNDMGSGPLQSILGVGGLSELTGNIGRASGLSGTAVTTMIGFLAPVVLGTLKKLKQSRGLDASGLSSLLSSQRSNIAAAMPEVMSESETNGSRTVPHTRVTETYSNTETERRKSSAGWILPLALLAGLLGLIWYAASRPSVHAGRDDNGLAERTSAAREHANIRYMVLFDALKSKYQSVIEVAKTQGVQISNLTVEKGTLVLHGTAPSLEAANKLQDEIKRVNPRMDDIVADIKVDPSLARPTSSSSEYNKPGNSEPFLPRTKPTVPESPTKSASETYVVKSGDTLATISKQFYGNARDYMRIFNENRSQLKNPNSIQVGQTLEIPMK